MKDALALCVRLYLRRELWSGPDALEEEAESHGRVGFPIMEVAEGDHILYGKIRLTN